MEADRARLLAEAREAYRRADADPAMYAEKAAALVERLRGTEHPEALVVALRAQAWAERGRLADTRAKALLDEAVRVARRNQLPGCLAEVLVTRAAVNHELGRLEAARRDLDAAAPLVDGVPAVQGQLQLQQAVLHHNSGRLTQAADLYRTLLARPDTSIDVRGKVGNNLAMIEAQRGLTQSALRRLDDAARAAAQVGPALTASVLQTRGWVCVQAGRLAEGLGLFEQASRLFDASGLPLGELHMEYADALVDLRLLPEAAAATARAVEQFRATGVRLMAAEAQLRAARLALLSGDQERATSSARQACDALRGQRRPAWAARADVVVVESRLATGDVDGRDLRSARHAAGTLDRLGLRAEAVHAHLAAARVALALGRTAVAREGLSRARQLSRGAAVLVRLDGRIAAALEAGLLHHDGDVRLHCRAGLRDLARHRSALSSMELRARASAHGLELGSMGAQVALRSGSATAMLGWLELARSATHAVVAPPGYEQVEDQFAALRAVHARLADPAALAPGEREALQGEQSEIELRLRRSTWARAGSSAGAVGAVGVGELRRALDGRVLVEYGVLGGELFAVVLRGRGSRLVALGDVRAVDEQSRPLLFALRRLARRGRPPALYAAARRSAEAALAQLRDHLLTPLSVPPDLPLVVVPSAALHGLPWAALHSAPVALAPSASAWVRTLVRGGGGHGGGRDGRDGQDGRDDESGSDGAGRAALVAGPDLPGAVEEVEALRRLHRRPSVLRPPMSTVDAVARALDGAAIAHLACHGRLRADNPTFSSLWLSDGPLTLQELDSRALAPVRIVLASCESGAQVRLEGDEVLGFANALMARGTAGIVASMMSVPDVESVPLMCALHEAVGRGATLDVALHAARSVVDREDPAAFVVSCAYNAYGAA